MSEKNYCESGKHVYREVDVVRSILGADVGQNEVLIVVACSKCDSKFLREVVKLL